MVHAYRKRWLSIVPACAKLGSSSGLKWPWLCSVLFFIWLDCHILRRMIIKNISPSSPWVLPTSRDVGRETTGRRFGSICRCLVTSYWRGSRQVGNCSTAWETDYFYSWEHEVVFFLANYVLFRWFRSTALWDLNLLANLTKRRSPPNYRQKATFWQKHDQIRTKWQKRSENGPWSVKTDQVTHSGIVAR